MDIIHTEVGSADGGLAGAVGVVDHHAQRAQMVDVFGTDDIPTANQQAQRTGNPLQLVHFQQQIRETAEHRHLMALDVVHQPVDVGLGFFRWDAERGTAEQGGKDLLHEDVERADGVLQHAVARLRMELMLESTDIVEHILVSHHHALGLTRRAAGIENVGEVAYLIYIIVYILDAFVRHHKVTVFHHILDALLGERRFGWHISGTRLQRCQDGGNHLYRMAHHDAHLGWILYGEAIGNLSSHCVQFAISQAFLLVHHGYRIRMCRHLLFEYIINCLHICLAFYCFFFRLQFCANREQSQACLSYAEVMPESQCHF